MTATALTVTTTAAGGTVLPAMGAVDASNGNSFTNTGKEIIEVTNGGGSPITITFVTDGVFTSSGGTSYAVADLAVSLAAGASKVYGPFDKTLFSVLTGDVQITWSSGTSVTCRVLQLGTT